MAGQGGGRKATAERRRGGWAWRKGAIYRCKLCLARLRMRTISTSRVRDGEGRLRPMGLGSSRGAAGVVVVQASQVRDGNHRTQGGRSTANGPAYRARRAAGNPSQLSERVNVSTRSPVCTPRYFSSSPSPLPTQQRPPCLYQQFGHLARFHYLHQRQHRFPVVSPISPSRRISRTRYRRSRQPRSWGQEPPWWAEIPRGASFLMEVLRRMEQQRRREGRATGDDEDQPRG